MSSKISITVDGFPDEVTPGTSLAQLIERHQAQHKDLVVEHNGRFVPPPKYEQTEVSPGDRVELIHPAFGG